MSSRGFGNRAREHTRNFIDTVFSGYGCKLGFGPRVTLCSANYIMRLPMHCDLG